MERKIGEIFEYKGEWYQCVKSPDGSCKHCDMNFGGKCPIPIKECVASSRSDLSYVIFKKLEKVGEPIKFGKKLMQDYKVFVEPYVPKELGYFTIKSARDLTFLIEIKQNKENMEENKLNLKPFDLEAAKAGKPVCTRDGRKARIICFDRIDARPIIALIKSTDGRGEDVCGYFIEGKRIANSLGSDLDLMMFPEKKEGWVNIDKGGSGKITISSPYSTKEEAIHNDNETTIDTIKISWEE